MVFLGQLKITLSMAKKLKSYGIDAIPGTKLCRKCYEVATNDRMTESENTELSSEEFHIEEPQCSKKIKLDRSLSTIGVSPVKLHALPKHQRLVTAKNKYEKAVANVESQIAEVYGVDPSHIAETSKPCDCKETKNNDFVKLTEEIREKLQSVNYRTKIQILTLTPYSWSRKYAANYFRVTEHQIRKARKLKEEQGILAMSSPKIIKRITDETLNLVTQFYEDDEYSRLMPGKKDYVSIKRNVHCQKRLLLLNLNELFAAFKEKFPSNKIGFSKFCSLRPKWCVTTDSSGTHSVCVCTYHQNAKLLVNAIKWDCTYKDLMKLIVCDVENQECMIHRCANCPGINSLEEFLKVELAEYDPDEEFMFNQWQSTDRTTIITQATTLEEYKEILCKKIDNLTTHSFISKAQGQYLKECKENLSPNECLWLGDFAENYQFVIQDEVQSYHWNKDQCTLHPVVLYYKSREDVFSEKSFCFLSSDNEHDTCFVYKIQYEISNFIKMNLPHIKLIKYFSDGCAGQYKNYKNFLNLCHHKEDFGIDAEWSFFATSHGKSPCDGIGGTVKRLTSSASLKRTINDQILTVEKMFTFCKDSIKAILFILIAKEQVDEIRRNLTDRFKTGKTVPGTRSYHHFIPVSKSKLSFGRTSYNSQPLR